MFRDLQQGETCPVEPWGFGGRQSFKKFIRVLQNPNGSGPLHPVSFFPCLTLRRPRLCEVLQPLDNLYNISNFKVSFVEGLPSQL